MASVDIILLKDLIEQKTRKAQELEYYQQELDKLQRKMFFLQKDIEITETIIEAIEKESILDIDEYLLENNT